MSKLLNFLSPRRRRLEQELDRELRHHLETRVEHLRRAGLAEDAARRQAAIELGPVTQVKEDVRDTWMIRWIDDLARDFRYALRTLRRSPVFTATAVLSLALGVGGNAAIVSLFQQILLRQLPVKDPQQLVLIEWRGSPVGSNWGSGNLLSYPLCRDLQQQDRLFDGVICRHPTSAHLSTGGQPEPAPIEIVSGGYFQTLGVLPALGRLLEPADDLYPEAHPVIVLSYDYWKNRFAGDPSVIGRKLLVNNHPMTVVGVAPRLFRGVDLAYAPVLWIPTMMKRQATPEFDELFNRRANWLHIFGRLRPGMTPAQARVALQPWFQTVLEADANSAGFPRVSPDQRSRFLQSTLDVLPAPGGRSDLRNRLREPLFVLMAGTALLLLLAAVNVANLFLARGAARLREVTTRLALGASNRRVAGHLIAESMLVSLGGGILGLLLAPAVSGALLSFFSHDLESQTSYPVFLFGLLVCAAIGLVCGLIPALRVRRSALFAGLKDRSSLSAAGSVRLRQALLTAQVAFTLILLIGVGLFLQTLYRLQAKGPGFAHSGLLMFRIDPVSNGYSGPDSNRIMQDLWRRLEELPGIERVAVANAHLLNGGSSSGAMTIQSDRRFVTDRAVHYMRVGPGFFTTLGAQLLAGRDFDRRDIRDSRAAETPWRYAIVSESFARRYFGSRSPIGARIGRGSQPGVPTDSEIIGVVRGFSRRSLRDDIEQAFFPFFDRDSTDGTFYVRTRGKPESAFASIRAAVAQADPALPLIQPVTLDEQVERSLATERMLAAVSTGFGAIALTLSLVGIYGMTSFLVTRRTQEIGLRLALGATRGGVVWLIVRDALLLIGAGTVLALPTAWLLRRLVENQLFGVSPVDATTIAAATALLAFVAVAAATLPSWRATLISPTEALRPE